MSAGLRGFGPLKLTQKLNFVYQDMASMNHFHVVQNFLICLNWESGNIFFSSVLSAGLLSAGLRFFPV